MSCRPHLRTGWWWLVWLCAEGLWSLRLSGRRCTCRHRQPLLCVPPRSAGLGAEGGPTGFQVTTGSQGGCVLWRPGLGERSRLY